MSSRPAHGFTHTPVDLAETYAPPQTADIAQPQTRYAYNKDKQLTQILRPDGQQLEFLYNAASGKLETLRTPDGDTTQAYDAGRLAEVKKDGAVQESYVYDANGNRTSVNPSAVRQAHSSGQAAIVATYDDQDRLLTYGATSYTFSDNRELQA